MKNKIRRNEATDGSATITDSYKWYEFSILRLDLSPEEHAFPHPNYAFLPPNLPIPSLAKKLSIGENRVRESQPGLAG